MSDLISRQDVIALAEEIETKRLRGQIELTYAPMIKGLQNLPSAQPEIIRCKECKYWFDIDDGRQKHRMCADFFGEWFCADAERRTDE